MLQSDQRKTYSDAIYENEAYCIGVNPENHLIL